MITYEKCIMIYIAYGEIHEFLTWKIWASLIQPFNNEFMDFMVY